MCPQMCSVLQVLLHRKFSVLRLVVAVPNVRCARISTAPQIKWRLGPEQGKKETNLIHGLMFMSCSYNLVYSMLPLVVTAPARMAH